MHKTMWHWDAILPHRVSDVLIEENRVSVGIDGDQACGAGGALVRFVRKLHALSLELAL